MLLNTFINLSTLTGNLFMVYLNKMENRSQILQMCQPTYVYYFITYRLLNLFSFHIYMRSKSIYPYLQKHTQTTFKAEEGTRVMGNFSFYEKVLLSFQTYFASLERLSAHASTVIFFLLCQLLSAHVLHPKRHLDDRSAKSHICL